MNLRRSAGSYRFLLLTVKLKSLIMQSRTMRAAETVRILKSAYHKVTCVSS